MPGVYAKVVLNAISYVSTVRGKALLQSCSMTIQVRFETVTAATHQACEPAQLVWVNENLIALLLPAEHSWFLQLGFGRCEGEGLLFSTLEEAENWVRGRLSIFPT